MADRILLKRSSTPSAVPTASDLVAGELAINTADGRLFLKKGDGTVVDVTSIGGIQGLTAALAGKVGDGDARLTDAREWTADTVSQAEAEAGTATTRRAWTAQRVRQAIVAWWNGISSAWGRGFVASTDAAAGRTALELGNAATRTALGTTGALYSRDSILGAVSQSGGVPTGAIIERGSNANGGYTRFADGTQICYALIATWTWASNASITRVWTYPAAFVGFTPVVHTTLLTAEPHNYNSSVFNIGSDACGWAVGGVYEANSSVFLSAIGRWF